MAGSAMWFGIVAALLLCLATAGSYAALSNFIRARGPLTSSPASLPIESKSSPLRPRHEVHDRLGQPSLYWVYPGCMVGVTASEWLLMNQFFPDTFSGGFSSRCSCTYSVSCFR